MKKILLIAVLLNGYLINAQTDSRYIKGIQTEVTHWGSLSIWIGHDFFSATRDSIVSQIGEEEFEWMKNHCTSGNWPKNLYNSSLDEEEDKKYEERLNKLKKYKIASFQHIYNGKTFERYAILRVPYDKNQDWDPLIKWEKSVYFLLKETDTKEIE